MTPQIKKRYALLALLGVCGLGIAFFVARADTFSEVTVQTFFGPNISDRPYVSVVQPNGNKNGPRFCPSGTVMCGLRSAGYDNKGTIKANQPLCCAISEEAAAAGVRVQGSAYKIDRGSSGASMYCRRGDVVQGAEWGKNSQLDFGFC